MNDYQRLVHDFHRATGSTIGKTPELRDNELRAKLIMEEAVETVAAMGFHVLADIRDPLVFTDAEGEPPYSGGGIRAHFDKVFMDPDFPEVIDGLCDLLYVTFGTAVAAGIDLDPFFNEVHATNMAKLAGEKRADGKQLKPEGWRPPRIQDLLDFVTERAEADLYGANA